MLDVSLVMYLLESGQRLHVIGQERCLCLCLCVRDCNVTVRGVLSSEVSFVS